MPIPSHELFIFTLATFGMSVTPGPNMIYLISRSMTQGTKAGFISLLGVVLGFLFHVCMVSYGLTAILLTVPLAYTALKTIGVFYLLYLAFQAMKPGAKSVFEVQKGVGSDTGIKLFSMGFLTNVFNPKIAMFELSFFPQFIRPEYGSIVQQGLTLGAVQMSVSFSINLIIILSASRIAVWFSQNPHWIKLQKWFMASVLTGLAVKMAFSKSK